MLILEKMKFYFIKKPQTFINKLEWNVTMEHETKKLMKLSKTQALIDCNWMYKLKYNPTYDERKIYKISLNHTRKKFEL